MSIWQTKNWQEMLKDSNQIENFFEIDGIFIEKRSLGFGQFGLFGIGVNANCNLNLENTQKLLSQTKSLFIQIENINYDGNIDLDLEKEGFKKGFYKKFITPHTAIINLKDGIEKIYSQMKPKGRYNIKLAQKKDLEVKIVEKNDENIKIFHSLMQETTKRDGFSGNNFEYYKTFLSKIIESKLIFVYLGNEVLSAGIFVFFEKIGIYYYGASSSKKEFRNLMAPYLMQDFAIKLAIENGCEIYDFLGVKDPEEKVSSLDGVTDFKSKFTPDMKKVSQSYIFVEKKLLFYLLLSAKKIKKYLNNFL